MQTFLSQARIEINALRAQLVEASEQKDSIESHANHVQEQKDQLQLALAQAQETHAASLAANRAAMNELRQEYAVQIREVQEKLTEAQALKQKDLAELTQFFLGQEKNLTESFVAVSQAHEEALRTLHQRTDERDASIAQLFEQNGFAKDSLTIIGWGDNRPIVADRDANGNYIPEAMAQNRRVVIYVYDRKLSDDPIKR